MIAIIDYDAGNLRSVQKALQFIGEEVVITRDHDEIMNSGKVILPGVGAFGDAMQKLHSYHLINTIKEVADCGKPLLGICLGQQLMFEGSEESEGIEGLGLLPGKIIRIPEGGGLKIPHIGWNNLNITQGDSLYQDITGTPYVYFVHSYYLKSEDRSIVAATTEYGTLIDASVEKNNIYACQFHPEKSGEIGLKILKNFASLEER
ncbi:imidazole glycerol phosphate synthase subunit HisH [Lachnoclostridium phytofermentans]|uniref:Imidazole glycerol phosphate synthase subunit HisH n=1 Tax=Lachnoclostridium phytofermentans (strain ATCC 700394 / DSM 18823 / ISDg) TaxID=357809 RepID=A9KP31_LACP7|nr:imidazole glycerol phosphate synthase subunit HisH [Lachnoclostridium phytofermentans]ABX43201.1 imidazole glycerol phosphate synthase, glutamine amidotransferase subunit [Lachnoclostridium phytofermentans ISDg]